MEIFTKRKLSEELSLKSCYKIVKPNLRPKTGWCCTSLESKELTSKLHQKLEIGVYIQVEDVLYVICIYTRNILNKSKKKKQDNKTKIITPMAAKLYHKTQ